MWPCSRGPGYGISISKDFRRWGAGHITRYSFDESGIDRTVCFRRKGWAKKEITPVQKAKFQREDGVQIAIAYMPQHNPSQKKPLA